MSFFTDDKYQDRAWDWAKQMSGYTDNFWKDIFQGSLAPQSGGQSPWTKSTMGYAENALAPFTGQQGSFRNTDLWRTLNNLYQPWAQQGSPYDTELYQGAEELYQPTVEPLYDQLMDPLKRGIEGQYGNQMEQLLSTGIGGGALSEALANAAMDRTTALVDMERNLRSQDIMRLDQTQRDRAAALTELAKSIFGTQQAAGLQRAGALGQAGLAMDQQRNNQGLMANLQLVNLLNQLTGSDIDRATNMANTGVQGRYLTGQNLAGLEGNQNSGLMGGLMNMGSMLGLGLGSSGALGDMFGGVGSLFGGGGSGLDMQYADLLNMFGGVGR